MQKILSYFLIIFSLVAIASQPAFAALHRGGEEPTDIEIESKMAAEWRACSTGDDCQMVHYGCEGFIAANIKFLQPATSLAWKIGGDPKTLDCSQGQVTNYLASCLGNICTATNPLE